MLFVRGNRTFSGGRTSNRAFGFVSCSVATTTFDETCVRRMEDELWRGHRAWRWRRDEVQGRGRGEPPSGNPVNIVPKGGRAHEFTFGECGPCVGI